MKRVRVAVVPKMNATDRRALTSFLRNLKRNRPTFFRVGMTFPYRGSTVTILEAK